MVEQLKSLSVLCLSVDVCRVVVAISSNFTSCSTTMEAKQFVCLAADLCVSDFGPNFGQFMARLRLFLLIVVYVVVVAQSTSRAVSIN